MVCQVWTAAPIVTMCVAVSAAPPPAPRPPPRVATGPFGIGDPQPFGRLLEDGSPQWHVFYLRSLQSGTWDHLVSPDLLRWSLWYNAITPAHDGDPAFNTSFPWAQLSAYTGSVMQGADGKFHAFYTAYGGGAGVGRETIVHAVSDDLYNFTLLEDNSTVVSPDGKIYRNGTARDFRDAFVFSVPPGAYPPDPSIKYMMAMAADYIPQHQRGGVVASPGDIVVEAGWPSQQITARAGAPVPPTCHLPTCVTGLAGSPDLYDWKLLPPIKDANGSQALSATECPDVFQLSGDPHWYIISGGYGQPNLGCDTVRASKDGLAGTFTLAPYPCIDRYIYAAKRMTAGNRTVAVAWVPGQPYGSECGYSWGGAFMTPRELWSNPSDVPGQIFSTLPPEYLAHYANFTSRVGPLTAGSATLKLPDSYMGHDPYLPNISCPWDNYAIVEVNATLGTGGSFNLTLLPEPLPPHYSNRTYMYWGYNLTVSAKHIGFEGGCESHDWDIPAALVDPVNVKCMVSQDLLECFVQDRYAMTIRGQVNTGNRTAAVTLTGPGSTITSAAVRTEFLGNRRCMLPLQGAPLPMNGAPVPWPRGCVSHCEQLCTETPSCVAFVVHADKAPYMASCSLKNCTTDFELATGFELFHKLRNGTFAPGGALAPPQQLPGMPPVKSPNQCSVTFPGNATVLPPVMCPLRYSCHGDCKSDPFGPHASPDCDGECLSPPPPPPPPPPRAFCNVTNSTTQCPGGTVCPVCPKGRQCPCPPWPPVAPWVVLPACLSACQKKCDGNASCAGLLFSRTQVDGQQCSFAACRNLTVSPRDANQWIAFAKNGSGAYTEHDWTTYSCPRGPPVLTPYNCQTGSGGVPPPPPPPPPPPLVNCTTQQLSAPRHSSLWLPGVPNGTGLSWAAYLEEHRASYDTLSHTWAFWNSKYNSKCNDTAIGRNLGLCGRAWSPDEQIVIAKAKELKMRIVPNLEVCCVCVLNATNNNYTAGMALLVADAASNGFDGFVLDMICGGYYEKERATFLSTFKSQLVTALAPDVEPQVSWFSHGFYHPEGSFPNGADYLYDMDTYTHPNYAPAWVQSFSCQAGIGLEWPGCSDPSQMAQIFDMTANLTNLRAVGTWGAVPNGTAPLNAAWFDGLAKFLSTG